VAQAGSSIWAQWADRIVSEKEKGSQRATLSNPIAGVVACTEQLSP
jgi:hypothetical protein